MAGHVTLTIGRGARWADRFDEHEVGGDGAVRRRENSWRYEAVDFVYTTRWIGDGGTRRGRVSVRTACEAVMNCGRTGFPLSASRR